MKIEINFLGVDLEVTGDYFPGQVGRTSGPPENCYPEEPSSFEIESIVVGDTSITEMFQCFAIPQNTKPIRHADAMTELAERCCEQIDNSGPEEDGI